MLVIFGMAGERVSHLFTYREKSLEGKVEGQCWFIRVLKMEKGDGRDERDEMDERDERDSAAHFSFS